MAWPSSSDIDTTKLDNDNDSIKDSRAELYKMAGYVNDMIDVGPSGLGSDNLELGEADSDQIIIQANSTQANKGISIQARSLSTDQPAINLYSDRSITIAGGTLFFEIAPRMWNRTTAERDAIPNKLNGMIIYNESTHKFQGYANGTWVDLH